MLNFVNTNPATQTVAENSKYVWKSPALAALTCTVVAIRFSKRHKFSPTLRILYALSTLGHDYEQLLPFISEGLQLTKLKCLWDVKCCLYYDTRKTTYFSYCLFF